jgi:hypothetical protein
MSDQTRFGAFAAHIMSDDDSDLGKMKAERDYALHCLEREIAICAQTQAHNDALVSFAKYVLEMDPESKAPLFVKARAALASIKERA